VFVSEFQEFQAFQEEFQEFHEFQEQVSRISRISTVSRAVSSVSRVSRACFKSTPARLSKLFKSTASVHYAKSYRPFELFVNENHKL